ncbi:hypothetical protein L0F63_006279, partial [Massospora cicadina]
LKVLEREREAESLSDREHALPDGGFGWVVVGASFMVSFIIYGLIFTFNFFTEHYETLPHYANCKHELVYVGTLNLAILNISSLFTGRLDDRFGHRRCILLGALVYTSALVLSAFATSLWQLILTQGLMLGAKRWGDIHAAISAPMQWFDKKRGLASGISMSGCGLGSLTMALAFPRLLEKFGDRSVLLGFAAFSGSVMLISALVIRDQPKVIRGEVIWRPMFLLILVGNATATLGYIVPNYLMKPYAISLGYTNDTSSHILSTLCASATASRVIGGVLADRLGAINTLNLATVIMALSCSAMWVFSKTSETLLLFGLVFGLGVGGFVSLPPMITSQLFGIVGLSTINGWLYFTAAFPALLGVPIANKIIELTPVTPQTQPECSSLPSITLGLYPS